MFTQLYFLLLVLFMKKCAPICIVHGIYSICWSTYHKKLTQENILPNKLYIIKYSQVSICIELVSHFEPADKNYWWVISGWKKKKLDQECKIIFLIHRYFKILNFHVGHVAVGSTQVQSTKTQIVKGSYWDLL